ncbi:ATP-binding domain-containing protein [Anaerocolumna sp. AGMB13025]|uniref:ATP-binding domain-containing protein n=1 Tax=Anaerocolumna sp. AGMB13025 TaxID=3039116 RepID=UPI002FE6F35E
MSKGLEFDAVLICDADSTNYHSEDDKKLLYIASTRALHRLNLFCKGEASLLL